MHMKKDLYGADVQEGYEMLGHAIITQAAKDYRKALKRLLISPKSTLSLQVKKEVEQFFYSDLFLMITDLDPDLILKKLQREVDYL